MFSKPKPTSVEAITGKLHDTVAELERHAEDQLDKAYLQKCAIAAAEAAHDAHKVEHELARTVASNIKSLPGL
jgi:hypothetical protein